MNSRELWSRLRVGFRAGEARIAKVEWRDDVAVPQFKLRARWTTPAASGTRECWQASFSARHKNIIIDTRKPRARLKLVG